MFFKNCHYNPKSSELCYQQQRAPGVGWPCCPGRGSYSHQLEPATHVQGRGKGPVTSPPRRGSSTNALTLLFHLPC